MGGSLTFSSDHKPFIDLNMDLCSTSDDERNHMPSNAATNNCDPISSTSEDEVILTHPNVTGDDRSLVPHVGMEFKSHEDAYKFYVSYALRVGFVTKVCNSHSKNICGSKHLWNMAFTCNRQGYKRSRLDVDNPRSNSRIGCKAQMRIKRKGYNDSTWICTYVATEHNHDLSQLMSHFHQSHKNIAASDQQKIIKTHKLGIRTSKVIQMLATEAGGIEKLNFGQKKVKTFVDLYRRMSLTGEDANTIQNHFIERQRKNPSFFYDIDIDKGRLINVFWVDARCRESYKYFGETITFDTTFLTKKYDMPFAPIVGVNHHGQSVLFGCGLLANETTESYIWLFETWLKAMGRPPISMITDQCAAIQAAMKKVFPEVRCRLCLWHIMKKQAEKFGGMHNKGHVMKMMNKCVYDSCTVEEFERDWNGMIMTYNLENNEWLQSLYEVRKLWVPVYLKNIFFAGMQTTQRSESISNFFDGYVHSKSTLTEFFEQYDRALQDHYQKEIEADFYDFHSNPSLKMNHCFEVQGASFYTKGIFDKFQHEVFTMGNCSHRVKYVEGFTKAYNVKETTVDENGLVERREYEVTFDALEEKVSCMCCLFEFQGILCNHALSILYAANITNIPSCYMLQRWRKDYKRTHDLHGDREQVQARNSADRSSELWLRLVKFSDEASASEERYLFAIKVLDEAMNQIRNIGCHYRDETNFGAGEDIETNCVKKTC